MARKTRIVEIQFTPETDDDGNPTEDAESRRFRVKQMKVKDGHRVLEKLTRILSPVLGEIAPALPEDADDTAAAAAISAALEALPKHLEAGDLQWIVDHLRKVCETESDEGAWVPITESFWDDIFAGEYAAEARLIGAFLKHNFGSFFSGGAGGVGLLARLLKTPSSSSTPKDAKSGSGG